MRLSIVALVAAAALSAAGVAHAAPTCVDESNLVRRCGTPGAMPVGWTPPDAASAPQPAPEDPSTVFSLICIVGGLFALIALMPDFDGDWGPPPPADED
jgi:hypothetical protein